MTINTDWPIDLSSTSPGEVLPLYRGDASGRNRVVATLVDNADAPVDMTVLGDTWEAAARDIAGGVIPLDVDDTNVATGVLVIAVPDELSAGLADRLDFDVQVTGGPISPLTIYKGTFSVDGQVTT